MAKLKSKTQKKLRKAMKKTVKKGPYVAALAVIVGEIAAAASRKGLGRAIRHAAERAVDRLRPSPVAEATAG